MDRNNLLLDGRTMENKGKLILTEIFPSVQKHLKVLMLNKITFIMGAVSLVEINMCCTAMPYNLHKYYVIFADFKQF